jgi:hypothetical protein
MVFGTSLPGENHPKFIVLKSNPIVVGMKDNWIFLMRTGEFDIYIFKFRDTDPAIRGEIK